MAFVCCPLPARLAYASTGSLAAAPAAELLSPRWSAAPGASPKWARPRFSAAPVPLRFSGIRSSSSIQATQATPPVIQWNVPARVKLDLDDINRLTKGDATKAKGGSRNVPHRLTQSERLLFEIARTQRFAVLKDRENVRNIWEKYCHMKGMTTVWVDQRGPLDFVGCDVTTSRAWEACPEEDRIRLLQRAFVELVTAINGPDAAEAALAAARGLQPGVASAGSKASIWDDDSRSDSRPVKPEARPVWEPSSAQKAYDIVAIWERGIFEVRGLTRSESKHKARAAAEALEKSLA
eukprot:tig00000361_g24388.t1